MKRKLLKNGAIKPMRKIEEVQKEYGETCAQLGDVTYRVSILTKNQKALEEKLYSLNKEGSEINIEKNKTPKEDIAKSEEQPDQESMQ